MTNALDAWIVLRLQMTIKEVTECLDNYTIQKATRKIKELFDDISKWYIRANRDRFAEGDLSAIEVLYYVFIEAMKLLAPFAPFISEHIYRELVATINEELPESIHLTDYPEADLKFIEQYSAYVNEMNFVRRICEMGHELRVTNQLKVRQPLAKLDIQNQNETVGLISDWMKELIKNELNVLEVNDMMKLNATDTLKTSEDTGLKIIIGLETEMSPELKEKGLLREIVRQIQSTRKSKGLEQGEKVRLYFTTKDSTIEKLIEKEREEIMNSTNLDNIEMSEQDDAIEVKVEDSTINISFNNGE
jgi:isoleucyl-tRNA synthetase